LYLIKFRHCVGGSGEVCNAPSPLWVFFAFICLTGDNWWATRNKTGEKKSVFLRLSLPVGALARLIKLTQHLVSRNTPSPARAPPTRIKHNPNTTGTTRTRTVAAQECEHVLTFYTPVEKCRRFAFLGSACIRTMLSARPQSHRGFLFARPFPAPLAPKTSSSANVCQAKNTALPCQRSVQLPSTRTHTHTQVREIAFIGSCSVSRFCLGLSLLRLLALPLSLSHTHTHTHTTIT
jgi:hypothetical protein